MTTLATAELIERARTGRDLHVERTGREVAASDEAERTLALGAGHVHRDDIAYATHVDRFAFSMEVTHTGDCLVRLDRRSL